MNYLTLAFLASSILVSGRMVAIAGAAPATDTIVVAPGGSDDAPGTAEQPVATPHQAQRLARQALARGRGVSVTLKAGT
jgi:hypothetical protein